MGIFKTTDEQIDQAPRKEYISKYVQIERLTISNWSIHVAVQENQYLEPESSPSPKALEIVLRDFLIATDRVFDEVEIVMRENKVRSIQLSFNTFTRLLVRMLESFRKKCPTESLIRHSFIRDTGEYNLLITVHEQNLAKMRELAHLTIKETENSLHSLLEQKRGRKREE